MNKSQRIEELENALDRALARINQLIDGGCRVLEVLEEVGDPTRDAEIRGARHNLQAVHRGLEHEDAERDVTPLHRLDTEDYRPTEG